MRHVAITRSRVVVGAELGAVAASEEHVALPEGAVCGTVHGVAEVDGAEAERREIGAHLVEAEAAGCQRVVVYLDDETPLGRTNIREGPVIA